MTRLKKDNIFPLQESQRAAGSYDEYYFRHACGAPYQRTADWLAFFGGIAERIVRDIGPGSVLDAGCAMGFLVEGLRERGVEAYGIDISDYALQQVRDDMKAYCRRASVVELLPQRYDLIVCIEVLEHLGEQQVVEAIAGFCEHTDDVLFSSTPLDYREATHFNVQPPEYWAELFARHGFVRDLEFDASFITSWAARFRRSREPLHRIVRQYERRFWQLRRENVDLRGLSVEMRDQLATAERNESVLDRLRHDLQDRDAALQAGASRIVALEEAAQAGASRIVALEEAAQAGEASAATLKAALQEREQAVSALRTSLEQQTILLEEAKMRLAKVTESPNWRVLQTFSRQRQRLAPPGTTREMLWYKMTRFVRSLMELGPGKTARNAFRALRRRN